MTGRYRYCPPYLRYEFLLILFIMMTITGVCGNMGTVAAHAVVKTTSLRDDPLQPWTQTTVTLYFNTRIELSFSQITLVTPNREELPLKIGAGANSHEVQVQIPPLPAGDYAIRYQVFAEDGHLTEGYVRFHITERK